MRRVRRVRRVVASSTARDPRAKDMGAITSSAFEREEEAESTWLVEHRGLGSPWSQFTLRRYGAGFSATGVSASVCLPRLLRRRLQDWHVQGLSVYLGSNFVSFGRKLESISRHDAGLFYGIDIFFGDNNDRASWFWYCRAQEWLLQLHKAMLEPLPAPPPTFAPVTAERRWPGQPRFLAEENQVATPAVAANSEAVGTAVDAAGVAMPGKGQFGTWEGADDSAEADGPVEEADIVDHQLSLFLGNADGHVGLLVLPIPRSHVAATKAAVERWSTTCEVPLEWAGRSWSSTEDFNQLREAAFNMPDILLLGLETELAMALTPDWTWEKYPRGFGDAALPLDNFGEERDFGALLGTPPSPRPGGLYQTDATQRSLESSERMQQAGDEPVAAVG